MEKWSINQNWNFFKISSDNIEQIIHTTALGENVDLPHTWYHEDEEPPYRGGVFYTKTIKKEAGWNHVYIDIPAADQYAKIWVNGCYAGEHKGGYSGFRVEVPSRAMEEEFLTLQIYVSNALREDISPLAGDFTIYGGLYRGINLMVSGDIHFDYLYYGTDGVIPRTSVDAAGHGWLSLEPHTVHAENAEIFYEVLHADGTLVASKTASALETVTLYVERPVLWDGLRNPYLYQMRATIIQDGRIMDRMEKTVGFCSASIDAKKGFFLNGRHIRLNGVAKHQDFAGCYSAVTEEQMDRDFELIHEIGANAVRLSHYQHPQHTYDLCDQKGYIVWAEVPMLKMTQSDALQENILQQLTELILQNIHHPSIRFWGIQNEIGMFRDQPDMYEKLSEMVRLVKRLDPNRLVTAANLYSVKLSSKLNQGTDLLGYNAYFGWYYGEMKDYDSFIERFHTFNPDMPIGISEYGADANYQLHSETPLVQDYSEEYQALFHESVYPILEKKEYLWGSFVWNMFDFSSAMRKAGGLQNLNGKGLVTFDRKIRKDAFYYYKAKWSKASFVHICSKRFIRRNREKIAVKVYTNQPQATLSVNNQEIQTLKTNDNGTIVFEDVTLIHGKNQICVRTETCADQCIFIRQEKEEEGYRLPDSQAGKNARNWFLDEDSLVKEGYYSIESILNDLLENPETAKILQKRIPDLYRAVMENDQIPRGLSLKSILSRNPVDSKIIKQINEEFHKIPVIDL